VVVEKFSVWMDPWFELLKFKRGDTEFIWGWLPMGGYVKLKGMVLEDGALPQPSDLTYLSLTKQSWVLFAGPLSNLIIGLCVYFYQMPLNTNGLLRFAVDAFIVVVCFSILLGLLPKIFKNKPLHLKMIQQVSLGLLALLFYIGLLAYFTTSLNHLIPFISHTSTFMAKGVTLWQSIPRFSTAQLFIFSAYLGLWLFFMNLLPLGGMIGYYLINPLYKSLVGKDIPEKFTESYTIISFFLMLFFYGKLIWNFVF
jgi:membrane-associated protease RseP (regulator of RpoE activity)